MGHAIRKMMRLGGENVIQLSGTAEMGEKYFNGKSRYQLGITQNPGSQNKHTILAAVQRKRGDSPLHVEKVKTFTIMPAIDQFVELNAKLMTDKNYVFQQAGKRFYSYESAWHFVKEYAQEDVHVNAAEFFGSML
jgi:hypothetical protein